MESTNLPSNQALEQEIQAWQKFRRALRKEDQQCLDRLFEMARLHAQTGGEAARSCPFETILICILLEQEKAMVELRLRLKFHKKQEGQGNV